jgi:3-hydroxybutyryl-CoA dehydratase
MTQSFLEIGETATFSKTITEADLVLFSGITGDFDPIHVDEDHARKTAFGRRIVHGGLVMGLLSTTASIMSRRSAQRGAKATPVSLGYDRVRFLKPVFIGDTLTARYTVEELDAAAARSRSRAEVFNQSGELVLAATHIMKWVSPAGEAAS